MRHVLTSIVALCVIACVALSACTKDSSDARESSNTETSPNTETSSGTEISSGNSEDSQSSLTSTQAFAALRSEITELQKTATTQQRLAQALEQIASKLNGFIQAYPNSEEALDAKLELGMVYSSLMKHDQAVKNFTDYLRDGDEDDERTGYAQFYLAQAYENMDKYDDAKRHYKMFVEQYGHLNPKYLAAAQSKLADISVLKSLTVGKEPIPFSVTDHLTGKTISLEDYKGKVVLLDFWATWCVPCKVEMPNVIKIHKKYNKKGFEIIGISLDNNKAALEQYIKTNEMPWPQHFDGKGWQNGVAMKYRVRQIPTTYLIDRKGKIRYRTLRGRDLEDAVARLIDET
ncbi:MAG: redoxin domain-containing protein [Candidatus Latescibacterota bacterium]|nr:MAG: redoxin domain-containing protein [Candidatus Latescibacterota bacterium]